MAETQSGQNSPDDAAFVISRTFNAPAHAVFAAWADGAQLQRWFGPPGMTVEAKTVDVRPGGTFHYTMTMPNGEPLWGHWTFHEVSPPARLVFVSMFSDADGGLGRNPWTADWPDRVLNTVTFAEHDGRTMLMVHSVPTDATDAQRAAFLAAHGSMQQGWGGTLDQLRATLAT